MVMDLLIIALGSHIIPYFMTNEIWYALVEERHKYIKVYREGEREWGKQAFGWNFQTNLEMLQNPMSTLKKGVT